jgi:hypothetical protein
MNFEKWVNVLLGGFVLIFLAACTIPNSDPPQPISIPITTLPPDQVHREAIPEPFIENESLSPSTTQNTPESILKTPRTKYTLHADFDYETKTVSVMQTIIYTNNTGHEITELPILVPPAYTKGVFTLGVLQVDHDFPNSTAEFSNGIILLMFELPLQPDQSIEIRLVYQLLLPQGERVLGYTNRQVLLADWYPLIPPYHQSQGWMINPPGQVGEHIVYPLSDFLVNLCLAPTVQGLVVAASAPQIAVEAGCYHYAVDAKRNFSLGISPYYQVSSAESDLVKVISYTFPDHSRLGPRAAQLAVTSWETFTNKFGDNQRDFLSIVEAEIFDGLETDGLVFLSEWYYRTADPSPQNYFELLIIHETVHQWFYGLAHNDQANEPWLDEALATYSEVLFLERHHPELVNWWWDFRVAAFEPKGAIDASIYDFRQFRPYIDAVYLRGALFLEDLRKMVSDEIFFDAINQYTQLDHDPEQIRTAADLFSVFSQLSDADFTDIITEYFQKNPTQGYNNAE